MQLLPGDCLEQLKTFQDNSIDALVTDPPAGISFMGKSWDSDKGGRKEWISWMSEIMRECLRVMKPGAHGLIWAIPRTSHWTAMALEDAGFEIRDVVTHLFGQGFPKSLDISKAIDKAAGAELLDLGQSPNWRESKRDREKNGGMEVRGSGAGRITAPSSPEAKQWQGFGTALKPAAEFWILVRKPCSEKTVAANVLKWGCGGLNIDGSRIGAEQRQYKGMSSNRPTVGTFRDDAWVPHDISVQVTGRFPANLVLSHSEYCTDEMCDLECAIKRLDEQSGERKSAGKYKNTETAKEGGNGMFAGGRITNAYAGDTGGASRFFYCAKISPGERGEDNKHPTVKPKKLMSYLIKLITPPNGTVLDPFMGSGSTGLAAKENGFEFIGIEKEPEYFEIAKKRIFV